MAGITIHFIGIGGIGMSGIARLCLSQGYTVQGSDLKPSELLSELETMGARIFIGHDAAHVTNADLVVYSSSIVPDHPEREEALKRGLTLFHRAEALAQLCRGKFTVAVAGTHGKTTTTGLVGTLFKEAGREPTVVLGGIVSSLGGNAAWGAGHEMVIEADESDSSFLKFSPDLAVITNIEEEHMDHFKDKAHLVQTFREFLSRLSPGGQWFGCAEDPVVVRLAEESGNATLYGFENSRADLKAVHVVECPGGERGVSFEVMEGDETLGHLRLKIMGRHNALNALAAVGVGLERGIPFSVIASSLNKYEGARRRFDVRFENKEYLLVDDYAHHPTEIRKTLEAAKALKKRRLVVLFQPHRFSRTESLLKDFGTCFRDADKVIVTDIYGASEAPRPGVSGEILCEEVQKSGHPDASFVANAAAEDFLRSCLCPGDLVMVMGAGDINQVTRRLVESLGAKNAAHGIFDSLRGNVLRDEPLAKHTSLKIGGPAEFWVEPVDEDDLARALGIAVSHHLDIRVFGAGSNLLAPDEGLKGVSLHLAGPYFKQIRLEEGKIFCRAGVPNSLFIQFAVEHGFGGCEFLLGIPGNIGGAVAMNAGSHGQCVAPCLDRVTTVGFNGERRTRPAGEIVFSYRHFPLRETVITEVVFNLPPAEKVEAQKRLEEYRQYRARTQDLRYPSAGCMFKNPEIPGCSSGRLIEEAGLKGRRVGNACVSEKHANFIVNLGGATALEVTALIEEVQKAVKKKFNIELQTEVKILSRENRREIK